jgi:DNA-binding MarR family transcriptional regulator
VTPEFDPAAARVLRALGRLPGAREGEPFDADEAIRRLAADGDPLGHELAGDERRATMTFRQLAENGLLERLDDPIAPTAHRYRLTALGRSRLGRTDDEED